MLTFFWTENIQAGLYLDPNDLDFCSNLNSELQKLTGGIAKSSFKQNIFIKLHFTSKYLPSIKSLSTAYKENSMYYPSSFF